MRVNDSDLINRVTMHYREQFIYQIHKVLGSADFLGNPVGLFNTLSSGVAELFYEPYQGMIMNDGPQELGIGIARVSGTYFFDMSNNFEYPILLISLRSRVLAVLSRRVCSGSLTASPNLLEVLVKDCQLLLWTEHTKIVVALT
jgi:Vacuolar-sorting-associated 13 protein C-terminal